MASKQSFLKRNGLSIALLLLMLFSLAGQFLTGWSDKNNELILNDEPQLNAWAYLQSGHFIQATFENWESEFLQMALYVLLTVKLFQVGSSESKDPDKEEEVDREPKAKPGAPSPVKKGGVWLWLYSRSLSISFTVLFLASFALHFYGSLKNHNEEQLEEGLPPASWAKYIGDSGFWFESFQNWQSEFLSVASIVILSIWLRQKGSPESKPVDAPHSETGGG
ncbi:DUF6766 family protein [Niabella yanshanensis]|uniref:DUF6766 family protein n=1 Tax=Niabella yanshanensis TaxID=577386 RepID=A0ABZ0W8I6_9BACT|nr:DUF6766 family protein [Niabella yanshanensis]WQD38366.1 DUF6766 family protein [Niabella yanshanensis]